jgi:hypothetical protein
VGVKNSSLLSSSSNRFWDPTSPLINKSGVNFSPREGVNRLDPEAEIENDWGTNSIHLVLLCEPIKGKLVFCLPFV